MRWQVRLELRRRLAATQPNADFELVVQPSLAVLRPTDGLHPFPPGVPALCSRQGCDAASGVQGARRGYGPSAGGAPDPQPAGAGGPARSHGGGRGQPRRWARRECSRGGLQPPPAVELRAALPRGMPQLGGIMQQTTRPYSAPVLLQPSACWWMCRPRRRSCWPRCACKLRNRT